jgi:hypothetical protein
VNQDGDVFLGIGRISRSLKTDRIKKYFRRHLKSDVTELNAKY